ncbi:MAG: class I SAM-dependent methyltransferase [Candidatus Omnitrophota bacterium]
MNLNYVSCNLCGQDNAKVIETSLESKVVQCRNCRLVYVNPQPAASALWEHYDKAYYEPWMSGQNLARKRMWEKRLKKVAAMKPSGNLLDVGCGTSNFLHTAKEHGFKVWGTEVSGFAVDNARKLYGIDVFKGDLIDSHFQDDFFDVITLWHVLEHTTDPFSNIKEAAKIVKPDGILVIAVPNINNFIYKIAYTTYRLRRPKLFSPDLREIHLYHFSIKTLSALLDKAGLKVTKAGIDSERILIKERIIDSLAWAVYKTTGVNLGLAFEVYAQRK